jgi:quercetin dioxygenase-like cupin family protein
MALEAEGMKFLSEYPPNFPGHQSQMVTVEYPPGASGPLHRECAHALICVLEGTIILQEKNGRIATLIPGQIFYEGPKDVYVVARNASKSQPAKFVVFSGKGKGAPVPVSAN